MNFFPGVNLMLWILAMLLWSNLNWYMFGICTAGTFIALYSFIVWALGDRQ